MAGSRDDSPRTAGEAVERVSGLLSRISNAMVQAQKEYFGKGPDRAKSYLVDDLLFVVMRGGITVAEQTMLQAGQADLVREFRQRFENEMGGRLTAMIEELTGRHVINYQSQVMFEPDVILQVFVFDEDISSG
jgi:uncharacterized protein YbcI